ncbi:MAG: cupin domain-containing protein, partial [Rhizobiales bacterium]|nr:cupin domain-containing protein [Hyphomicrobiales bacterium]
LGTWGAVWEAADKDEHQNATQGRVTLVSASGNYVSSDGTAIGLIGVDDLVVVASDDTVLVAPRGQADSVKALVAAVGREASDPGMPDRRRHYRPWGHYRSVDLGPAHEVRRLVINPGQRLSLQMHRRRSKQWTVVAGTGEVTLGDTLLTLAESESIHIPAGVAHRAANRGTVPLEIVDVQCGARPEEDDTVRLEDDYGRAPEPESGGPA